MRLEIARRKKLRGKIKFKKAG